MKSISGRRITYASLVGVALLGACTPLGALTESNGLEGTSIINQAIPTELLNGNVSSTGRGISFGQTYINEAVDITLPINNYTNIEATSLTATVPGGVLTFTGGGAYPGAGGTCTGTLAPAATCNVTLTFTPTMQQDYYLTPGNGLVITFGWNGQNNTMNVPVIGRCDGAILCGSGSLSTLAPAGCSGTGPTLSLPVTCDSAPTDDTVTITNAQAYDATDFVVTTPSFAPFECGGACSPVLPGNGGTCTNTLLAGQSCTIVLRSTVGTDQIVIAYTMNGQSTTYTASAVSTWDTGSDVNNCGACGNACGGAGPTCTAGVCSCAGGETVCSNVCADLITNHNHCGSCGNVCANLGDCAGSACVGNGLSGNGSMGSPYLVATASDFVKIGRAPAAYFRVTADIDLTGITVAPADFQGVFDGNHHTISNWSFHDDNAYNVGVFGVTTNATITDLVLTSLSASTANGEHVGGLVGTAIGTTISGCSVQGTLFGYDSVGGLVGRMQTGGSVSRSSSSASVSGSPGGLVGGLIGWATDAPISDCYATGSVGTACLGGGLVGDYVIGSSQGIRRSFATGSVSGSCSLGGLVGDAGWGGGSSVDTFWDTQTSGRGGDSDGATGKTTAQMKTQGTFTNFDFTNVWQISGGQYPTLR